MNDMSALYRVRALCFVISLCTLGLFVGSLGGDIKLLAVGIASSILYLAASKQIEKIGLSWRNENE